MKTYLALLLVLMAGCENVDPPKGIPSPGVPIAPPMPSSTPSPAPTSGPMPLPCYVNTPTGPKPCASPQPTPTTKPPTTGIPYAPAKGYKGDPGFTLYVEWFIRDAAKQGKIVSAENLRILWTTPEKNKALGRSPGTIGTCTYGQNASGWVEILSTWFTEQDSDVWRMELMHHELSHCILGRGHVTAYLTPSNDPTSLMFPNIFSPVIFKRHEQHYLTELYILPKPPSMTERAMGVMGIDPGREMPLQPGDVIHDTAESIGQKP